MRAVCHRYRCHLSEHPSHPLHTHRTNRRRRQRKFWPPPGTALSLTSDLDGLYYGRRHSPWTATRPPRAAQSHSRTTADADEALCLPSVGRCHHRSGECSCLTLLSTHRDVLPCQVHSVTLRYPAPLGPRRSLQFCIPASVRGTHALARAQRRVDVPPTFSRCVSSLSVRTSLPPSSGPPCPARPACPADPECKDDPVIDDELL
ncbi:hypothetical protein OH77DRAFT_1131127 [Trametes cingulata]|nr:hypothetical protein OH77DRAFT_1131127 [Trametes cingulata]